MINRYYTAHQDELEVAKIVNPNTNIDKDGPIDLSDDEKDRQKDAKAARSRRASVAYMKTRKFSAGGDIISKPIASNQFLKEDDALAGG